MGTCGDIVSSIPLLSFHELNKYILDALNCSKLHKNSVQFYNKSTTYLGKDSIWLKKKKALLTFYWLLEFCSLRVLPPKSFLLFTFVMQVSISLCCTAQCPQPTKAGCMQKPRSFVQRKRGRVDPSQPFPSLQGFVFLRMGPSSAWGCYLNHEMILLKAMETSKALPSQCLL